jgi:hypothetical protein
MCYKYTMNPSSQRFTISSFSIFLAYIFLESISLKYYYGFSLYKVTDFTIGEFSCPLKMNLLQVLAISHLIYQILPATTITISHLTYQISSVINPFSFPYQVTRYHYKTYQIQI